MTSLLNEGLLYSWRSYRGIGIRLRAFHNPFQSSSQWRPIITFKNLEKTKLTRSCIPSPEEGWRWRTAPHLQHSEEFPLNAPPCVLLCPSQDGAQAPGTERLLLCQRHKHYSFRQQKAAIYSHLKGKQKAALYSHLKGKQKDALPLTFCFSDRWCLFFLRLVCLAWLPHTATAHTHTHTHTHTYTHTHIDAYLLEAGERQMDIASYRRIENAEGNVLIAVYLFIYLLICMRVIRITKTVLNRIAWNLVRWLVIIRGPFD